MQVVLPTDQGQRAMTVKKIGISVVDVDLNHPMAGKTLSFDVEILDVREATSEEIAHKHVHGMAGTSIEVDLERHRCNKKRPACAGRLICLLKP